MERHEGYVVALESRGNPDPITWATGAVVHNGQLCNPITGARTRLDELEQLVADGNLGRLPKAIHLDWQRQMPRVLVLWSRGDIGRYLRSGSPRGAISSTRVDDDWIDLFDGHFHFDRFCETVCNGLSRILADRFERNGGLRELDTRLLDAGLILAHDHPELLALHAAQLEEPEREYGVAIGLASLKSFDKTRFQASLNHLLTKRAV
jgi:hypothetical protein